MPLLLARRSVIVVNLAYCIRRGHDPSSESVYRLAEASPCRGLKQRLLAGMCDSASLTSSQKEESDTIWQPRRGTHPLRNHSSNHLMTLMVLQRRLSNYLDDSFFFF